jgi:ABC-type transport system substrate-binding protein
VRRPITLSLLVVAVVLGALSPAGTQAAPAGRPDIDDLFLQQARERDTKKREALLHRIQELTIDRAMFAPVMEGLG